MSEQEVVDMITKVSERLSNKFTFAFYTTEDIRQEAFIIGMEALERYDESKPLENFLFVHMANRILREITTFVRTKAKQRRCRREKRIF